MSIVTASIVMEPHRLCRMVALGALLLATGPAWAAEHADGADPNCGVEKPFREVAEDETRRIAEICPLPREVADEETAGRTLGMPDTSRRPVFARAREPRPAR